MEFLIVTGMSGAGKSTVLRFLEDIGFHCIDNMPPALIPKFAELIFRPGSDIEKVALGIYIRGGRLFDDFLPLLNNRAELLPNHSVVYLDASDETLLKRFKETRRTHPLTKNGSLVASIEQERDILRKIKDMSDIVIDTDYLMPNRLKEKINQLFLEDADFGSLTMTILSFGFKHGTPEDLDLLFDVRFLPNPFYIQELKFLTGNDQSVADYVLNNPITNEFLAKTVDMLEFLVPLYIEEGKTRLVIGIGCTGGKHRSVALTNYLNEHFVQEGYFATTNHRDIGK